MKKSRSKSILAVLLFPETFEDAADILCEKVPFLRMLSMRGILIGKASFFAMFAVSISNEENWDIKAEEGIDVEMCVSFKEVLCSSPMEEVVENELRRHENYIFLESMISDYVRVLESPKKKLKYRK